MSKTKKMMEMALIEVFGDHISIIIQTMSMFVNFYEHEQRLQ